MLCGNHIRITFMETLFSRSQHLFHNVRHMFVFASALLLNCLLCGFFLVFVSFDVLRLLVPTTLRTHSKQNTGLLTIA